MPKNCKSTVLTDAYRPLPGSVNTSAVFVCEKS